MLTLAGVSACVRALGHQRDGAGDAAAAGVRADARAVAPEPGLDGEGGGAETGAGAEGDVVVGAVEVERRSRPATVGVAEASLEAADSLSDTSTAVTT